MQNDLRNPASVANDRSAGVNSGFQTSDPYANTHVLIALALSFPRPINTGHE